MSGCDCVRCQTEGCDDSELCGCCLNAEVERLTTAIQRVRELAEFWKAQVADSPSGASWVYMSAASRLLLDALDGPDE